MPISRTLSSYHPDAPPWNEANGIPWSETSTRDLIAALEQGSSIQEIANYLQYSENTVRAKMQELGLNKRPAHAGN
jgi:DNA-binding NarL/FixJ family response regulator